MRPSTLYNYLQQTKPKGFVQSTTREKKEYFRFELAEHPFQIMDYRLTSHHISIYEKIDTSKSDFSPYHYTGYLNDTEECLYRIHVNFNYNGQVVGVVFSKQLDETFTPIDVEQLHEQFIELAQQNCEPVIFRVLDGLNNIVTTYIEEYNKLTKDAEQLSEHIEENLEKYDASLTRICDTLNKLIPLTEDGHYRSLYLVTQRLQKAIASQYTKYETMKPVLADAEELKVEQLWSESPHVHSAPRKPQPNNLDKAISSLVSEFKSLSVEDEPHAKGLADIFSSINECSLLLEDHNYTATVSNYKALSHLIHEHQQAVMKLLYRLFLTKKLELTQHLSFSFTTPAFQTLLSKTLELALHRRDSQLLDFRLTHGNFSVDKPLRVAGVEYTSIIDYCEKNNPETDPMIDCVIVLIKHKAFFKCDDRGLPIAYAIITSGTHPLKIAFNRLTLVERSVLYRELVPALNRYLLRHPDDPQKDTINSHIIKFVTLSKHDSSHQARITYGRMKEEGETLYDSVRRCEVLKQLTCDPEIIELQENLRLRYMNFQGPKEIKGVLSKIFNSVIIKENQSDLDNAVDGLENVSVSTLKANTIQLLRKINDLFGYFEIMVSFGGNQHKKESRKGGAKLVDIERNITRLMSELQIGQNQMTVGGVLNLIQQPASSVPSSDSAITAPNIAPMRTSRAVFFPATPQPLPKDSSTQSPDRSMGAPP